MVCNNRGIYGFLGTLWVLNTLAPCNSTNFCVGSFFTAATPARGRYSRQPTYLLPRGSLVSMSRTGSWRLEERRRGQLATPSRSRTACHDWHGRAYFALHKGNAFRTASLVFGDKVIGFRVGSFSLWKNGYGM